MANISNFLQNVVRELKIVSWPTSRQMVSYTITVLVTVAFVAVFFALLDLGISKFIRYLLQFTG